MAPLDIFPTINSLTILCMCVPAEKPRPGAMLRAPLPHPSFFPLLPTRCPACLFLPTPQAAQVCVCPACKSPGFFTSPRKIAVRARHLHFFLGFFFFLNLSFSGHGLLSLSRNLTLSSNKKKNYHSKSSHPLSRDLYRYTSQPPLVSPGIFPSFASSCPKNPFQPNLDFPLIFVPLALFLGLPDPQLFVSPSQQRPPCPQKYKSA